MFVSQPPKKVSSLLLTLLVVMGVILASSSTQAKTEPVILAQEPGLLFGVGNEFQITGSTYLNAKITSSESIELYLQSVPRVITLALMPSLELPSTQLTIAGLAPHHTYYKYEDDFHNLVEFQADEFGTYSFTQDISQPHLLFIQEDTSTLFLNVSGGGDCATIGTWNPDVLTCTLTQDVTDTIQIDSDHITLDGNGYRLSRSRTTSSGVHVPQRTGVTITNLTVSGSTFGIALVGSTYTTVSNNTLIQSNGNGIYLQSSANNTLAGNTVQMRDAQGTGIMLFGSSLNTVTSNVLTSGFAGLQSWYSSQSTLTNNIFEQNRYGIQLWHSSLAKIYNNDFLANQNQVSRFGGFGNVFNVATPAGGNYWSNYATPAQGCNDVNSDGFCDASYIFLAGRDEYPYINPINEEQPGNSNVLFLPGFQGSRLYRQGVLGEDELWVPTVNQDAKQLFLNDAGESIDPGIYTRDIIDRTKFLFPIYEDFIEFMDEDMVVGGVINEWRAFPYDWRFAVDDIADQPELQQTLQELAASSASGKVTIIAHSNGGLVAKLLLNNPAIAEKVDRLILVATPQLGTPKTIGGLLHGYDQGINFVLSESTARELGENMPGAYGLLPLDGYFDTVTDPVVTFSDDVSKSYDFRLLYGETIDTIDELVAFLQGDNGQRLEPAAKDLKSPNVLSSPLLADARSLQSDLVSWQPPEDLEVIQIAGWGLDTVYQFKYDHEFCLLCAQFSDLPNLTVEPEFTIDGDKTVVVPSSVMETFGSTYFLNFITSNRLIKKNREHKNILEVESIQELIGEAISENGIDVDSLPPNISIESPSPEPNDKYYRLRMKSPIALHAHDSSDRHTGVIDNPDQESDIELYEEQIPNSGYSELGERKYLNLDGEDTYTIKLDGQGTGIFTFEIDTVQGDAVVETIAYSNIPVVPELTGELILEQEPTGQPELRLDFDGDGEVDAIVPANGSLPPETSIKLLKQAVENKEINHGTKTSLLQRIDTIERLLERGLTQPADQLLRNLDRFIENLIDKNRGIAQEDALPLREIIAAIREAL